MSKPWIHAVSSARKFGGTPEDYIDIKGDDCGRSTIEEADYLLMFGDHVEVTVKAPGEVEVDDYSHD